MSDSAEQVMRQALEQYANSDNWLPTGINTVKDEFYHITFTGVGTEDLNGWLIAQRALEEVDNLGVSPLARVAKVAQEFLSLPRLNQANVHRHSELYEDLIEACNSAGYTVWDRRYNVGRFNPPESSVDAILPLRSFQKPQEQ